MTVIITILKRSPFVWKLWQNLLLPPALHDSQASAQGTHMATIESSFSFLPAWPSWPWWELKTIPESLFFAKSQGNVLGLWPLYHLTTWDVPSLLWWATMQDLLRHQALSTCCWPKILSINLPDLMIISSLPTLALWCLPSCCTSPPAQQGIMSQPELHSFHPPTAEPLPLLCQLDSVSLAFLHLKQRKCSKCQARAWYTATCSIPFILQHFNASLSCLTTETSGRVEPCSLATHSTHDKINPNTFVY